MPLINRGLTAGVVVVETSSPDLVTAVCVPCQGLASRHLRQIKRSGFPFDFQSAESSSAHDSRQGYIVDSCDRLDIGKCEKESVLPTLKIRITDP